MKRVLVVDDELLVRMGIRSMLGEGDSGYEVAGEAAGGREGAELIARLAPDLLLTDLVMAEGGGIELIEEARRTCPDLGIVVLSCRNEFEHVRQALRSGADDYVFKPTLKTTELIDAFARVLAKRPVRPAGPDGLAMGAGPGSGEILDGLLLGLLGGSPLPDPFTEGLPASSYRLLFLDFGPEGESRSPLADLLREMRRVEACIVAAAADSGKALALLCGEGRAGALRVFSLAEDFGGRYLGRLPHGGLSRMGMKPGELPGLLAESIAAADRAYRSGPPLAFAEDFDPAATLAGVCGDPDEGQFRPEPYTAATVALRRAVEALDASSMETAFNSVLDRLKEASDLGSDGLRALLGEASMPFKEKARALGLKPDTLRLDLSPEPLLRSARSLGELRKALPGFIAAFVEAAVGAAGMRREVVETTRWVLSDLAVAFRVEEAASRVGMSPSHFAHVFKKDTGYSFIDFVNQARMERARELLLGTDLLVRQVADKVGIESLNHFGQLFRRCFGISPNELKKKGRGIET